MNGYVSEINRLLSEIKSFLTGKLGVKHMRLNVMSARTSKLKMIAHTAGFGGDEVQITLTKGQGCSGKAWNTKTETITDLAKDIQWLSEEDQKRVKSDLIVILSIPLMDPDAPKLRKVIGTMTVDSTEPIYEPLKKAVPDLAPYVQKISVLVKECGL